MKTIRRLLSLLQLIALCQVVFGLGWVGMRYEESASVVLTALPSDRERAMVERWFGRTLRDTRVWCIGSGVASFALATGVLVLLRRQREGGKA